MSIMDVIRTEMADRGAESSTGSPPPVLSGSSSSTAIATSGDLRQQVAGDFFLDERLPQRPRFTDHPAN
jgi:hypothetical protein